MIIGNGLVAKSLQAIDRECTCFFASGVSASNSNDSREFNRENILLVDTLEKYPEKTIVYFSSCGIEFGNTPYFCHKLNMEQIVTSRAKKFFIFRLPQVVGNGGNKNTLFKHLISKIKQNEPIEVWINARRNLIDIDDVVGIANTFLSNKKNLNSIINIASPYNCTIVELLENIEIVLDLKVDYFLANKGENLDIDISRMNEMIDMDQIFKDKNQYLQNLIKKYCKEEL